MSCVGALVAAAVAIVCCSAAVSAAALAASEHETIVKPSDTTPQSVATTTVGDLNTIVAEAVSAWPTPRVLYRRADGRLPDECSNTTCFPKCCKIGETLKGKQCVPTQSPFDPYVAEDGTKGFNLTDLSTDEYYLLIGNPCKYWITLDYDEITLWFNGMLSVYESTNSDKDEILNQENYCMEYTEEDDSITLECRDSVARVNVGFTSWLYTFGLLISVLCLILTLAIYIMLETLRDLHGKSLICHVACLAISYVMFASVQLSGESGFGLDACRQVAFAIQFFLLSSFVWLHVMVVDSLWAVLEATGHSPVPYPRAKKWIFNENTNQWVTGFEMDIDEQQQEERRIQERMLERRVFAGYFIYVKIMSLLPILMVVKAGLNPTIPSTYLDQNMKLHNCVFESDHSLMYFYPIPAFITLANIIIFIVILVYAVPYTWNPRGPHRVPKQKARMCFLLFALMSSNWIIDIVSWALGGRQFAWMMLHAFYILQGLITFLIFVFEDRVKDRIKHKLLPQIRRVNRKYGCCNRPVHEEEATALRNNYRLHNVNSGSQTIGWVVPNQ